jgi:hypothetical protein
MPERVPESIPEPISELEINTLTIPCEGMRQEDSQCLLKFDNCSGIALPIRF